MTVLRTDSPPIPDAEFDAFHKRQLPAVGVTCVWISAYKGQRLAAWGQMVPRPMAPPPHARPIEGYVALLFLRRLVVQVASIFDDGDFFVADDRPGFIRIWPPRSDVVTWPDRRLAINDHEIEGLAAELPFTVLA